MKTNQFTPGPWRQTGINVRAGDALICYAMNHHANAETPEPEKLANARLIACAPELLSTLEQLLETAESLNDWLISDGSINGEHELFQKVRAIISKATGGAA